MQSSLSMLFKFNQKKQRVLQLDAEEQKEELIAADTDISVIREGEYRQGLESIGGARDTLKVCRYSAAMGVQLAILGLESQEKVHYAMPLRVMGYDYTTYQRQYDANAREFMKMYKTKQADTVTDTESGSISNVRPVSVTGEEYLSRMRRTDRFVPVVTVVIYYGEKPWDGAMSLHEMLEIPEKMKPYVQDYKMVLVEAGRNNLVFHNVNNQDLFHLFKLMLNKEISQKEKKQQFQEYCDAHRTSREVLVALAGTMHMNVSFNMMEKEEESVSCTFFEGILEEGRVEGRAEGKAEGIIEAGIDYGASDEDILNTLQRKLDISRQKAQEYFNLFARQAI
ncbi:MAG: transposase [Clostridiales bacterium]|nr:transposase [Clostridiales bacterium]